MQTSQRVRTRRSVIRDLSLGAGCAFFSRPVSAATSGAAVTLAEDESAYTLANATVTARVDKGSGDLLSLRYKGTEMLATILRPDGLPDTAVDKPGANLRGGGGR